MNWRYAVGKFADNCLNSLLRQNVPGSRFFPNGICYPFDITRLYRLRRMHVKTVFDVGANIGQTSRYLAPWFPQATIFAFEPISSTHNRLQQNTQSIPSIQCFHHAFGSREEVKEIALKADPETNTLIDPQEAPDPSLTRERVTVKKIEDFCANNRIQQIDLLKLDVEGYEIEALKGADRLVATGNVHFIYAETFFRWEHKNMTHFVDIHRYLYDKGYLFSGFYEPCRHWDCKLLTCFCNTLYVNPHFKPSDNLI
jgi:FkbM family methyltransferase